MTKNHQKASMTIMVMLSSDCCLPCYAFEENNIDQTVLSPQKLPQNRNLKNVLKNKTSATLVFANAYSNRGDRIRTYGLLLPKQAL